MGQDGGAVYVPPASEAITHDADGNLTGDGRWAYTWDSENRLIAMETKPALVSAGAPRQRLEFGYDAGHRRVSKVVKSFSSSLNAWSVASRTTFLYDGWNLIAEFDTSTSLPVSLSPRLLRSYEWGLDLSGTMTGAGGVGGLLLIRSHSTANNSQPLQTTSTSSHAPCYDGNGNLSALVNLATGQSEARYDYGPFGERVLAAGGAIAEANPFRFSTKYEDAETGLLYYGYRFYDSAAGRWINRDPIGERGGVNLFGMVGNFAGGKIDFLGLASKTFYWWVDFWESDRLGDQDHAAKFSYQITVTCTDKKPAYSDNRPEHSAPESIGGGYGHLTTDASRTVTEQRLEEIDMLKLELHFNASGSTGGLFQAVGAGGGLVAGGAIGGLSTGGPGVVPGAAAGAGLGYAAGLAVDNLATPNISIKFNANHTFYCKCDEQTTEWQVEDDSGGENFDNGGESEFTHTVQH